MVSPMLFRYGTLHNGRFTFTLGTIKKRTQPPARISCVKRLSARYPLFLVSVIFVAAGCSSTPSSSAPSTMEPSTTTSTTTSTTLPPTTTAPPSGLAPADAFGTQLSPCTYGLYNNQDAFPDPRCTPGATNPAVTQATIDSTICVSGYTSSIRPSSSVTYPEKRASMTAYGQSGSTSAFEYDHLVSLEVGGAANAAANLFPEPLLGPYGARVKDRLENRLHSLICSKTIPLAQAQTEEATNWIAAYNKYVGPLP